MNGTESNIDFKLEAKLGFDRVRQAVSDKCSTEYAASRAATEELSASVKEIRGRLLLTDEMRLILMFEEGFPTSGYIDCIDFLKVLENDGANIDLFSLGKLRTLSETLRKMAAFFDGVKDGVYPNLKRFVAKVKVFPEVSRRIDRIIDKFGNVKDTASDELLQIRGQLRDKEGSLSKRANAILKKAQSMMFSGCRGSLGAVRFHPPDISSIPPNFSRASGSGIRRQPARRERHSRRRHSQTRMRTSGAAGRIRGAGTTGCKKR